MPILRLRMVARALSPIHVMSTPSTRIRPLVSVSRPAMMPSSVDLPDPEGPTMATISPWAMHRLTPFRIAMCSRPSGKDL